MRKHIFLSVILLLASCAQEEKVASVEAGLLVSDNYLDTTVCRDCQIETQWSVDWNIEAIDKAKPMDTIKYIVLHSTSVDADAEDVDNSMGCRKASWHWTIDQNHIIHAIPVAYQAWHCGTKKRPLIPCYNSNSLSIEMCQEDSQNPDKVVENTWMVLRNIKESNPNAKLVRHFDVTGKACPLLISEAIFNKLLQRWDGTTVSTNFDENRMKVLNKLEGKLEPVFK